MQQRKRIGERLIEAGLITPEQLEIALEEQKKTGELIGAILFSLGFISQKDLFTILSMTHGENDRETAPPPLHIAQSETTNKDSASIKKTEKPDEKIAFISQAPVVKMVEDIIATGLSKGATDIHIGPDLHGVRVRYRIDGQLQHGMFIPKEMLPAIVSRIKIMGSMNIAENRLPQDGSTGYIWNSRPLDIRISTFPVAGGENIVMRLLDKSQLILGLENLGFLKDDIDLLNSSLQIAYGMILITGPTGSGKTTTLYSALSIINSVYKNIFTIEDPIEYQLPLIRQSQVNVKAGLTFASGLRSILRQDPDVILVGEMRDSETAELAIRASLTGHLVFSTLHTNDAASAIPRLIDMGIEPFLLASTIDTVVAQRLVRILCNKCKVAYKPSDDLLKKADMIIPEGTYLFRHKGCDSCNNTGYKGRTIIYEIMKMNDRLRRLVLERAGSDILQNAALESGMKSMLKKGMEKVVAGITSVEEVFSATRTVI